MPNNSISDWSTFGKATDGRSPRPLFVGALARFGQERAGSSPLAAIDLGCGNGIETLTLLKNGWQVLAIDSEPAVIETIQTKVQAGQRARLETRIAAFERIELPQADFVYAGYSLPFCEPAHFNHLWTTVVNAIRPGGRFAGQLFGVRDSWATRPMMTFHTAEQVQNLLQNVFEVEFLREEDEDGHAFRGPKHWHVFHIIARKIS
jgi:trans-aconitate methyltransferase